MSSYLAGSAVKADPSLLKGWFIFVEGTDKKLTDDDLKLLAAEVSQRLEHQTGFHILWLDPERDGRRQGASAFNQPLTVAGRRVRYARNEEGAITPL